MTIIISHEQMFLEYVGQMVLFFRHLACSGVSSSENSGRNNSLHFVGGTRSPK